MAPFGECARLLLSGICYLILILMARHNRPIAGMAMMLHRIFAIFILTTFWGIKSCFTPGKSSSAGIRSPLSCPSGGSSGPVGVGSDI